MVQKKTDKKDNKIVKPKAQIKAKSKAKATSASHATVYIDMRGSKSAAKPRRKAAPKKESEKPAYVPTPIYQNIMQPIPPSSQITAPVSVAGRSISIPTKIQVPQEESSSFTISRPALAPAEERRSVYNPPQQTIPVRARPTMPENIRVEENPIPTREITIGSFRHVPAEEPTPTFRPSPVLAPLEEGHAAQFIPPIAPVFDRNRGLTDEELNQYSKALEHPGDLNFARRTLNNRFKDRQKRRGEELTPSEERRIAQEILTKAQMKHIKKNV